MGISRFVRCDSCEYSEPLDDDVEPCDIGWLNVIFGPADEDMGFFCSLPCQMAWASADETRSLLEELAASYTDEEDE